MASGRRSRRRVVLERAPESWSPADLCSGTFETEGQHRTAVEIQVQHLGADVQFATVEPKKAEVAKADAGASKGSAKTRK